MYEFRIYYEALEQAEHFLKPALQAAVAPDLEAVRLVRLKRLSSTSEIAESLLPALSMKDPDGVITVIIDGREVPLVWIEISTAVETEDHLLQRFDSMVAAGRAGIPFVKVQARRVSAGDHGGKTNFDREMGYKLLWARWGVPAIELEWPTTADGRRAVRDANRVACPEGDLGLSAVIAAAFDGIRSSGSATKGLLESDYGPLRAAIVANQASVFELTNSSTSRLYRDDNGRWTLKFNRWGHAMDPERGMAWYYAARTGTRLGGVLQDREAVTPGDALNAFERATGLRFTGSRKLQRGASINIDDDLANGLSRAGIAIIWNCADFSILDSNGDLLLRITWTRGEPTGLSSPARAAHVTAIRPSTRITEDEVTYVVANSVLPENGFGTHSVSYPGAQGDFALLLGNGRTARRTYVDAIGLLDSGETVSLVESKGSRSTDALTSDAAKVLSWRDDAERRAVLLEALARNRNAQVLALIAYPGDSDTDLAVCDALDGVVAVGPDSWRVFARSADLRRAMPTQAGDARLPDRYEF